MDYLNEWILKHSPGSDVHGKYVRFDGGGELGHCTAVVDLFTQAGYAIQTTGANASYQNGPGKRPHHSIGDAM